MRAFVLVVERDLLARETLASMLSANGHVALTANSVRVALRMLSALTFDAMVISPGALNLGEESYAREAKMLQPHIKVIVASGIASPKFFEPPIDGYIQKPFSVKSLADTLEKVVVLSRPDT